jgi:hypothetical protein
MNIDVIKSQIAEHFSNIDYWSRLLDKMNPNYDGICDWDVSFPNNAIYVNRNKANFTINDAVFYGTVLLGGSGSEGIEYPFSKTVTITGNFIWGKDSTVSIAEDFSFDDEYIDLFE